MAAKNNVEAPIHEPMLIAGKRVDGPVPIEVRNPARPDDLVGTVVRGRPEHVSTKPLLPLRRPSRLGPRGPSWSGQTCLPLHFPALRTTSDGAPQWSWAATASRLLW